MTIPKTMGRLVPNQVHIQMIPTPRKLRESRQVLAALQKFGEVTTFRNLKYDLSNNSPNKHRPVIAIFESADAAQRAIASSPLFVALESSSSTTSTSPSTHPHSQQSLQSTKNKQSTSYRSPEDTNESTTPAKNDPIFDDVEAGTIKCIISSSRHNNDNAMRRNPFNLPYLCYEKSPIYNDMTGPQTGVPVKALGDVLQQKKRPATSRIQKIIRGQGRVMGAESLMDLWRDGLQSKENEEGGPPVSANEGLHKV